jgi:hypothetical protein
MTIDVLEAVKVRFKADRFKYKLQPGQRELRPDVRELQPGQRVTLSQHHLSRLLKAVPEKIKVVAPEPPLQTGWFVAYRDRQGRYRGGCDEPQIGTLRACRLDESGWTITFLNRDSIPLSRIISVGKTDSKGEVIAAWTVEAHGYDGQWIGPNHDDILLNFEEDEDL